MPVVIYVHLLVLGAIYIQWNFFLSSYNSGKNQKFIALTFDDGPGSNTPTILDILKEQKVTATFFVIGKNAKQHAELVKRYNDDGHLVGNHSYYHGFNFDWKSAVAMQVEIAQTNSIVQSLIGKSPKLFRPPYGVTNPNVAKAVKKSNMYSVGWNIRSFDTTAKNAEQLLSRILNKIVGGDIVLLHDTMFITSEILTELIVKARQKGFTFVRIDQLLDIDAYA